MTTGYLQHAKDWTITRDAIMRLSASLGHAFTYADLGAEIEAHDHLKIDPRGYASALNAVAGNLRSGEPMWTVMVVSAETGEPGEGFWHADYPNNRYRIIETLSDRARRGWLKDQQDWCVAVARIRLDPTNRALRDAERQARERAEISYVEHMRDELDDEGPSS